MLISVKCLTDRITYHRRSYLIYQLLIFKPMKTLAFLLVILVLFTFSSCSYILGLKSPTKIDKQFAISYLLKHDIDTSNVIFLKNGYLDTLKYLPFKPNWEPGFRPLQFKIFSKTGNLVSQYSSCEGSLKHTLIKKVFPRL